MNPASTIIVPAVLTETAKEQFDALMRVHSHILTAYRDVLSMWNYIEVPESALSEIATAYDVPAYAPNLTRRVPVAGNQGKLDALAVALGRSYFHISSGSQKETLLADESEKKSLSRFTVVEAVAPYENMPPEAALGRVVSSIEDCIKHTVRVLVSDYHDELRLLGSDLLFLSRVIKRPFIKISYEEALGVLNSGNDRNYTFGDKIGAREAKSILTSFCNIPVFIHYGPAVREHFAIKRARTGATAFATELLLPKLGTSARGAVLEEKLSRIKSSSPANADETPATGSQVAISSKVGLFGGKEPGGRITFSLSFERFVGFLTGTGIF